MPLSRKVFKYWRWLKYISSQIFEQEKFLYKKCFANNSNDSGINEMLYSKVRSGRVVINGKEGPFFELYGLDFTFTVV